VTDLGPRSTTSHGLSYLGTLRARMGVLIVPSFLLHATGGLAYGGARSDTTIVQSIDNPPLSTLMTSGSFSKTRIGYAAGAGGEWMLSSNWSAKLEYLYYDLGSVTYATGGLASDIGAVLNPGTSTGVAAVATSSQFRFKDSIVRVGVNYHFGSPAVSQSPAVKQVCPARYIRHSSAIRIGKTARPHPISRCPGAQESCMSASRWRSTAWLTSLISRWL
jgi:hypothetical protein